MHNVTIVTALYDLNRSNWAGFKRPFEAYKEWMKGMLSYDALMVIYVDPADVAFIEENRKGKLDKTEIIPLPFSKFTTTVKWGEKIKAVMKSDAFLKDQTVPSHPQIKYPEYNILMHEKIQFVKRAIERNTFNTEHFMWLDAGVHHISNRIDLAGKPYPSKRTIYDDDKVHLIALEEPKESDLNLEQFYKGHNVRIIGTSWIGHKAALLKFEKTYSELIEESLEQNLMDQDQSFLTVTYLRNLEICKLHIGNWQSALNNWG